MTIIAFSRYWVIRWPWVVVNLMVVVALISLSAWQWQRAAQKAQLLLHLEKLQQQGTRSGAQLSNLSVNNRDGMQMDFAARWLSPMIWLVDNQRVNGRIGYDVVIAVEDITGHVTPKKTDIFLINLGWIAAPDQRELLPVVNIPNELQVRGIFRTHTKGLLLGTNVEDKGEWPMRIQQVDTVHLSHYVNQPLMAGIIYQQFNSPFVIHYRPVVLLPERHKAYALQWLLLAVAVIVIALVASSHKREQGITP